MGLEMSCAFATSMQSPEHARVAERLGFDRAYFYDSPALYPDVWMQLGRAADRTERIVLGPAVLVPTNRHVMTNAAAIASLVALVGQERVSVALGSGRTARLGLGKKPLPWTSVITYVSALRALLRGDVVEWDGSFIQMRHTPGFGAERPIEVEILIAAAGPKGAAAAREVGDGAFGGTAPVPGFLRSPCLTWGTVVLPGEDPGSARVLDATGGAAAVFAGHYRIAFGDPAEDDATMARWRSAYADVPRDRLHLAVHEGHLTAPNARDRPFIDAALVSASGLALDRDGWRDKLAALEDQGATEVVYQPSGIDIPGELERFAALFAS